MNSKFDWKGYYAPTPKLFRKIGDTLMVLAGTLSGASIYAENKTMAMICLAISILGKIVTNFFTETPWIYILQNILIVEKIKMSTVDL